MRSRVARRRALLRLRLLLRVSGHRCAAMPTHVVIIVAATHGNGHGDLYFSQDTSVCNVGPPTTWIQWVATAGFGRIHFHTCDVGTWIERQSAEVHPASTAPSQRDRGGLGYRLRTEHLHLCRGSDVARLLREFVRGHRCAAQKGRSQVGLAALVSGFFTVNGTFMDGTHLSLCVFCRGRNSFSLGCRGRGKGE